jgi:hypothetical protein
MLLSSRDLTSIHSEDLHSSSVLGIEVYGHRIFCDEFIGGTKESIELLVSEGATGG